MFPSIPNFLGVVIMSGSWIVFLLFESVKSYEPRVFKCYSLYDKLLNFFVYLLSFVGACLGL